MEKNPRKIRSNSCKREWDDEKDNVLHYIGAIAYSTGKDDKVVFSLSLLPKVLCIHVVSDVYIKVFVLCRIFPMIL